MSDMAKPPVRTKLPLLVIGSTAGVFVSRLKAAGDTPSTLIVSCAFPRETPKGTVPGDRESPPGPPLTINRNSHRTESHWARLTSGSRLEITYSALRFHRHWDTLREQEIGVRARNV
jgi:hypothetical protein